MGKPAKWCAISGTLKNKKILVAILDSPANESFPTRFAVYHQGMQFLSSSPNFSEPKVLKQEETWHLQYRVVAAGAPPADESWNLDRLWQDYANLTLEQ